MMCLVLFLFLWGFVLSIIAFYGWFTYFVILCEDSSSAILLEDSSSPVWIRPLILLCGFLHCLRAHTSSLITGDSSPLL